MTLGDDFYIFSTCLAEGYVWLKFQLSSYSGSFCDTHTDGHTYIHTVTMTIPHSPDRRVRKNGLLFQVGTVCDQPLCSIVEPAGRRLGVMKLAHNSVHWAARKTKQRIILSGIT